MSTWLKFVILGFAIIGYLGVLFFVVQKFTNWMNRKVPRSEINEYYVQFIFTTQGVYGSSWSEGHSTFTLINRKLNADTLNEIKGKLENQVTNLTPGSLIIRNIIKFDEVSKSS